MSHPNPNHNWWTALGKAQFTKVKVRRTVNRSKCIPYARPYMSIRGMLHLSDGSRHQGRIVYRNMIASYEDEQGTPRHNVTWFEKHPECLIEYEDPKKESPLPEGDGDT